MTPTDFAIRLTGFLSEHLPNERKLSPNTIKSYRDAFALFLRFCRDVRGVAPERLVLDTIDSELVLDFLNFIERERGCKARTRNQRLAAVQSFFRYLQVVEPDRIMGCQRILAIPLQRASQPAVGHLSPAEISALLAQPKLETLRGRRDAVLLSVLYDTGARVQELIDLTVDDVRLEPPAQVRLTGKGRKCRVVPLMTPTADLLREYLRNCDGPDDLRRPLFRNRSNEILSRSGVTYILRKYFRSAQANGHCPDRDRISPHVLRHSKGMHLAEAGVPVEIIRDILGHSDIKTTAVYARASLQRKREALERSRSTTTPTLPQWRESTDLMSWLRSL